MPNDFLSLLPALIAAGIIWIIAALTLRFELYRLQRERLQGRRPLWYARPLLWFAASGFTLGLMLLILTSLFHFSRSGILPFRLVELLVMGLTCLFACLFCGGIIMALERPFEKKATAEIAPIHHAKASKEELVAKSSPITYPSLMIIATYAASMLIYLLYWILPLNWIALLWLLPILGVLFRICFLHISSRKLNQRRKALALQSKQFWRTEKPLALAYHSPETMQLLEPSLVHSLKRPLLYGYPLLMALFAFSYTLRTPSLTFLLLWLPTMLLNALLPLLGIAREKVEATSQGLLIHQGIGFLRLKRYQKIIPWHEARLFVCYPTPGLLSGTNAMTYELSSARQVLRWRRIARTRSLFYPWKTNIPFEEYDQRMQALCACITEQTGLPLHTLDDQPQREVQLLTQQVKTRPGRQ